MTTDAKAERERIERCVKELAIDLAAETSTMAENSYDPAHRWVCKSCDYGSATVLDFTKIENHDKECDLRFLAEKALGTVDAGQRTEKFYADAAALNHPHVVSLSLYKSDHPMIGSVLVQVSWKESEGSDG